MPISMSRAFGSITFSLLTGLSVWLCSGPVWSQEDEDDDLKKSPGLIARYSVPRGSSEVTFQRHDLVPALALKAGEAPDVRLPAKGWQVRWSGVLEVRAPGQYTFFAKANGPVDVRVGGKSVVKTTAATSETGQGGEPARLGFGLQPLEIDYGPAPEGAQLRLEWKADAFAREALPPFAVGHRPKPLSPTDPVPAVGHFGRNIADPFLRGRLQLEEHACAACHKADAKAFPVSTQLSSRPGPRLTHAHRLPAAWIADWLKNPQDHRPEAVMPALFSNDRSGEVQRHAVAAYLTSLPATQKPANPKKADAKQQANWAKEGERIFQAIGCGVCHEGTEKEPPRATLKGLHHKFSVDWLMAFVQNPNTFDLAGRMPQFTFEQDDAQKIAHYLLTRDLAAKPTGDAPSPDTATPTGAVSATSVTDAELRQAANGLLDAATLDAIFLRPADARLRELGRQVVKQKRCANCHELNDPAHKDFFKPVPAEATLAQVAGKGVTGGCVAATVARRQAKPVGTLPAYGNQLDLAAIAVFLDQALPAPGTPAPGDTAHLQLHRLNCVACHQFHGRGGLPEFFLSRLLVNQTEKNAEAVSPPPLTGVSEKLLTSALRGVLEQHQRSRPWMGMQMPRFSKSHVEKLPEGLATVEGEQPSDAAFRPAADPELIAAGRTLVGEKGFSCIKCHDMLDIPTSGTRGPDLAKVADRVTFAWYQRWMTDPQRMQPGTRMPTVFFGGKTAYTHLAGGDPEQQRLAMWQYLIVSKNLPMPEGLARPKALRFPDAPHWQVVRTFLPGTSARGIALKDPEGLHLAFDAQACRLAYSWSGEFLNMSPVWDGRGGRPASIAGTMTWEAPRGFPWEVTTSAGTLPDFTERGNDPTFGAPLPQDGKLYPTRVHFAGYSHIENQTQFRYSYDLPEGQSASFSESARTFRRPVSTVVLRDLEAHVPSGQFVWLNAASSATAPQFYRSADGKVETATENGGAPGTAVIVVSLEGKSHVLRLRGTAANAAEWTFAKSATGWSVLLRAGGVRTSETQKLSLQLAIHRPFDNAPTTIGRVVADEWDAK